MTSSYLRWTGPNWPTPSRLVRRVMEGVVRLKVPLTVDLRVGENWGEMNFYALRAKQAINY